MTISFPRRLYRFLSCGLALTLVLATQPGLDSARAATVMFDGGPAGSGTTLDTAENWLSDTLPASGDEVLLADWPATLPATLTLGSAQSYGNMILNSNNVTTLSLTGGTNRAIVLTGVAGGSLEAPSLGGAANDLLLLGNNVFGTVTIGGGSGAGALGITLAANATSGNIDVVNSGATLNLTAALSGSRNWAKTGLGTLILANANTYTGTTTVSGGTLLVNHARALQYSTVTVPASGLVFNSGIGNFTLGGVSGSNNLTLADNAGQAITLTVGNNNSSPTYSGVLSNISSDQPGALTKIGSGTLTLAGNNTYSGPTTVIGFGGGLGALKTTLNTNGAPFGSGTMALVGGTLQLVPGNTGTGVAYSGPTATSGNAFTYAGGSTVSLTKGNQSTLTYTVGGGGSASIGRVGTGTLVVKPSGVGRLGTSEFFKVNGSAPAQQTLDVGNTMVSPTIVGLGATTAGLFDFLTYDGTNGLVVAPASRTLTAAGTAYTTNANELLTITPAGAVTVAQGSGNAYAMVINAGSATTTISGAVTLGNGTGQAGLILNGRTLAATAGGTINFGAAEGVVWVKGSYNQSIGVPFAGTGGVTLAGDGAGPVNLTANSTFTGGITFNNGFVLAGNNGNDTWFGDIRNVITFNGGSTNGNLGSFNISTSRTVAIGPAGALFDANNSYFTFAGNITGTGVITTTGGGAANGIPFTTPTILTGNNAFGGVNIKSGPLDVASDANLGGPNSMIQFSGGTLVVMGNTLGSFGSHPVFFTNNTNVGLDIESPTNTFTIDRPMTQGTGTFVKSGPGNIVLTAPASYTGATTLSGGVMTVDAAQGGALGTTAPTFAGGTLSLAGRGSGTTAQTLGNVTVNAGGGTLKVDTNGASNTYNLTLGTLVSSTTAGASLNIIANGGGMANITTTTKAGDLTNGILSGRYVLNGADWATVTWDSTDNPISAYTSYADLSAGGGTDTNNSRITDTVSLSGATTTNSLKLTNTQAGRSLTLDNTLTLTSGGLLFTGTHDYAIADGTLNAGTGSMGTGTNTSTDLVVHAFGPGALTIGSVIGTGAGIAGTGVQHFTKAGTGTVVLGATNLYAGATYVTDGVLSIGNIDQLGATATAVVHLNGGTLRYTGSSAATTHVIQLGGSGGAFDVTSGATLTLNGALIGTAVSGGALTVMSSDGTGTLVLGAANNFADGVTINSGTLRLGVANALAGNSSKKPHPNTVIFGSAGTLQLNAGSVAESRTVIVTGLSSALTTTAVVENGNSSAYPVTLTVNNGDDQTFAGTIQNGTTSDATHGGLSIVKGGGGTWTLTGDNAFTGKTTLLNGALTLGHANALTSVTVSQTANGTTNDIQFGPTAAGTAITNGGTLRYTAASAAMDYSARIKTSAAPIGIDTNGQNVTFATGLASSNIGGLTKLGGGTLALAAANAYTGPTTVQAGTLLLPATGSLATGSAVTVANGGTLTGTGAINGSVAVGSGGTLIPGLADGGALTINNTLSLAGNVNFTIAGTSSYNQILGLTGIGYGGTLNVAAPGTPSFFAAGQTYNLFGLTGAHSGTFANLNLPDLTAYGLKWGTFNYAAGSIDVLSLAAAYTDPQYTLGLGSAVVNAHTGAPVGLTATITNLGGGANPDSISFTGLAATDGVGTIGGPTSGGAGTVSYPLNSTASTTGLTYTNATPGAYTLTASAATITGDHGAVPTLSGTAGSVTLHLYDGQSAWTGGDSATNTNWANYGNWDAGGAPGVYASNPTGDTATFGTTAAGPVAVNLSGANPSLTTLSFNSATSSYTIAQGTGGTLTLNGAGAAINVAGTHGIATELALAGSTTITTTAAGDVLTLSGLVSGSGDAGSTLRAAGPGLVILASNNTYSGGTTIDTGARLQVGNGGAAGSLGAGDVTNNGTLTFNRNDAGLVVASNISGAGAINQNGSGMTTLTGLNYGASGGLNVNAGTLNAATPASLPGGTIAVASGATLAVGAAGWTSTDIDYLLSTSASFASGAFLGIDTTNATATFTHANAIAETNGGANVLGLKKLGTGTLALTGPNTYSGGTIINGGTVSIASDANLGASTGGITLDGGTLALPANFTISAARTLTVGPGGGTITQPQWTNDGTNPKGIVTIAAAISGPGMLTAACQNGNGNPSIILSGNNSAFSGGITMASPNPVMQWDGVNASGAGALRFSQSYANPVLRLRSDASATFLASSVILPPTDSNNGRFSTIDVRPLASGSHNVLTLNNLNASAVGGGHPIVVTGTSGYSLAITTMNVAGSVALRPTTAGVAIGTVTGTLAWDNYLTLDGTATNNSIGALNMGLGGGTNALNVVSGGWTVTGASSFTGQVNLSGGALTLDFSTPASPAANILPGNGGAWTLRGGALALVGKSSAANSQAVSATTLGAGASTLALNSNGATDLSLDLKAITRNVAATLDIALPSGTASATNGVLTTSGAAGALLTANGVSYATVGGSDWAAKDVTHTFVVGLSTIAGGYTPSDASTLSGNADVAGGVTTTTLSANADLASLRFNQNQATTIALGGNTLTTGGILITSAVTAAGSQISGGTLRGPSGADLVVIQNSVQPLTIGANIVDSGAATGLTKSGPGTLILGGANSYTGVTTLNQGRLVLSGTSAGSGGVTVSRDTVLQVTQAAALPSGPLTVNRALVMVNVGGPGEFLPITSGGGSLGDLLAAGTWNAGSTIGIDTSNAGGTVAYSGAIGGANRGLAKLGAGTLLLYAASTYGGPTTVSGGGQLMNGVTNALPTATALTLGAAGETTGTNTFDLGGCDQTVRTLSNAGGAAAVVTNSFGFSVLTVSPAAGGDCAFGGVIQDGGGSVALTKAGAGALTLTGANTYSGTTTVNAGTLLVNGSLTSNNPVTVNNGGTLGGTGTIAGSGNVLVNAGGTLSPGGMLGTLTIDNRDLSLFGSAQFDISAAAGFANDRVQNIAGLYYGGTLKITTTAGTLGGGQSWDLFDFATQSGTFANDGVFGTAGDGLTLPLLSGATWAFDYTNGVLSTVPVAGPLNSTWAANVDGKWSSPGNWSAGVPNGPGVTANFTGNSPATVDIDGAAPVTVGHIAFSQADGGASYSLGGATHQGLVMDNTGGSGSGNASIAATAGSHTLTSQVLTAAASDLEVSAAIGGGLNLAGGIDNSAGKTVTLTQSGAGALTVGDMINDGAGLLKVAGGTAHVDGVHGSGDTTVGSDAANTATLITDHVRQDTLTINAGSKVQITGTNTSVVNFLQIANSSGTFAWGDGSGIAPAGTAGGASPGGAAAVPEPASWLLLVMACAAGLLAWRRGRQH